MELVWCVEYLSKAEVSKVFLYFSLVLLALMIIGLGIAMCTSKDILSIIGSIGAFICFVTFLVSCHIFTDQDTQYMSKIIVKINNEKVLTDGFLEKWDLVEQRGEYYLFEAKHGVKEETIDVG